MAARTAIHIHAGTVLAAVMAIFLEAATCLPATADTASQVGAPPESVAALHVRGLDQQAAALLAAGRNRSPTFGRLCDTLEQTDVIVLIKTGMLMRPPAQTTFVTAARGARFLRITLGVPEMDDVLLAWLAHELQHAVEIASAPEVVTAETMTDFFCRRGLIPQDGLCTLEAQRVKKAVAYELAASRRAGR